MASAVSRKKGTGQPLLLREKMAVVRYCDELKKEKPTMLIKEICEKAAYIFDVPIGCPSIFFPFHNSFRYRSIQQRRLKL